MSSSYSCNLCLSLTLVPKSFQLPGNDNTPNISLWNKPLYLACAWRITQNKFCPVGWGCRIYPLLFCREVRHPSPNECLGYAANQSDGEASVMLLLWRMLSTLSLPSLPGSLWPGVVAPDRFLSIGQIELNCILILNWIAWNRTFLTFKLCTYAKFNCLKWNCFWHWNNLY